MKPGSRKNKQDDNSEEKKNKHSNKIIKGKVIKEKSLLIEPGVLSSIAEIFQNSKDLVWICNLQYEILYVNDAVKSLTGLTPQKLKGKYLDKTFFCSDKAAFNLVEKFIQKQSKNRKKLFTKRFVHQIKRKNNLSVKAETEISSVSDRGKNVKAVLGITRIITGLNHNKYRLLESNLTLAQQLAHLGTYQFDQIKNNNQCSAETIKIFELSSNQKCFSLDEFYSMVHPDDLSFVKKSIMQAISKSSVYDFECRIVTQKNSVKYLHIVGQIVGMTKKSPGRIFGIVMDITEQKESEENLGRYLFELKKSKHLLEDRAMELASLNEQLKAASKELSSTNESKDKFFSILAHDLRSPFHGLLGFSNMLTADYDNLTDEERKNIAGRINISAHYVFKLIENLLEWSRLQSGRMEIKPVKVDLNEAVLYIFNLLTSAAGTKEIKLVNEVQIGICVYADQNMLNSVIENLLSNAIKFSRRNSEVIVANTINGNSVCVSIKDSGVGINKNDLVKLFKIDKHHSTQGTEDERGTGLGLILCKEMIEKMGGDIKVTSKVNEGSIFSFTLPYSV